MGELRRPFYYASISTYIALYNEQAIPSLNNCRQWGARGALHWLATAVRCTTQACGLVR